MNIIFKCEYLSLFQFSYIKKVTGEIYRKIVLDVLYSRVFKKNILINYCISIYFLLTKAYIVN
jgi:hypothetical protein